METFAFFWINELVQQTRRYHCSKKWVWTTQSQAGTFIRNFIYIHKRLFIWNLFYYLQNSRKNSQNLIYCPIMSYANSFTLLEEFILHITLLLLNFIFIVRASSLTTFFHFSILLHKITGAWTLAMISTAFYSAPRRRTHELLSQLDSRFVIKKDDFVTSFATSWYSILKSMGV